MKSVRSNWLDPGWEQDVKLLILASSQGLSRVSDWIMLLECMNALIKGTPCELTDAELRNHIQSHVHPDTMSAATHAELHLVLSYDAYKRALRTVDDACVRTDELLQAARKQMMTSTVTATRRGTSRITHNYSNNALSSNNPSASNTAYSAHTSSTAAVCVPALTVAERTLLQENDGCFKCCVFYADHTSRTCPAGFPDPAMYKPLTPTDVAHAKRQHNKKARAVPSAAIPANPVAVVATAPVAVVMPSSILGDGSESDSSYVIAPFYTPHFFLDCFIGGSTASFEISI
jgi:hypothetical protein